MRIYIKNKYCIQNDISVYFVVFSKYSYGYALNHHYEKNVLRLT